MKRFFDEARITFIVADIERAIIDIYCIHRDTIN